MKCIIELHFLPCLAWFSAISRYDSIILEKQEHYAKQSFRNRCHINTAHGEERLIIPVLSSHGKSKITEVRIDYSQKWLNRHWRTIESAYRNAPYYEHYADVLHQSIFRKHTFLYDLNLELLTICLQWLKFDVNLLESSAYVNEPEPGITDLRNLIQAKKSTPENKFYKAVPYPQVFGKHFVKNLSLVDLLFCEGPHALSIIKSSAGTSEQLK